MHPVSSCVIFDALRTPLPRDRPGGTARRLAICRAIGPRGGLRFDHADELSQRFLGDIVLQETNFADLSISLEASRRTKRPQPWSGVAGMPSPASETGGLAGSLAGLR